MSKAILPRHFIRVAAPNELKYAENALQHAEALMISQPFSINSRKAVQRCLGNYEKPFLIDPETYRYFLPHKHHFKGSKTKRKIRAWLNDMAKILPEEIYESFGKRSAKVENFDALQLLEFCQSNIEIQTSLQNENGSSLLPIGIMAPYLRLTAEKITSNLLFLTQVISTTNKINKSELPVVGVFYFSRDILSNKSIINMIKQSINNLECKSIAVWVDNFDETDATEEEINTLNNFYSEISHDKHIISMYGGLAQVMMMYNGLDSITHGVHYQLHKNGLASGGAPAYYFYLPNLHQRIRTIEAAAILRRHNFTREEYLKRCCDCPACKEEISHQPAENIFNLEGNESDIVKVLTSHFAYNKKLEIQNINNLTKKEYSNWVREKCDSLSLTRDEKEYSDVLLNWVLAVLEIDISTRN
ncbi:hypothetical protein AB1L12_19825 [Peribacillus frigoritolerans]|uniref:hypothetical protein n=1 Tax=Peribacillus frigoritolerans TaxID=450367 RepID=UPI0039A0C8D5